MAYRCALASTLAAVAVLAGADAPAHAQCRLCDEPTTALSSGERGGPIRIEVETSLDFDRLVIDGSGDGTATLLPGGDRSASGSVATLGASAMVGTVTVRGDPGRTVRVEMPSQIRLYSLRGATIEVDHIETDLPAIPTLDSAGNLSFRFGGRVQVNGDSDGDYRGDITITVDYI